MSSIFGRTLDIQAIENLGVNSICLLEIMAEVINQYDIILGYSFVISQSKSTLVCQIELTEFRSTWFESVEKTFRKVFSKKTNISNPLFLDVKPIHRHDIDKRKHDIFRIAE